MEHLEDQKLDLKLFSALKWFYCYKNVGTVIVIFNSNPIDGMPLVKGLVYGLFRVVLFSAIPFFSA